MKRFNAVHKGNGRKFMITFKEGEKPVAFDIERKQEKVISQKTVDRWYDIGQELKPEPEKKKGPRIRDSRKKMNLAQVIEIREKRKAGHSINSLAKEYGMSYSGMYWICKGNTWADLNKEKEQEERFKKNQEEAEKNLLYWYEYLYRGLSIGCQPKGFVDHKDNVGRFGIVAYDRPLTAEEMAEYELAEYKEA